jgi:hypothetical protein
MTRRMLACAGLALVMTVVTWAAPPAHAAAAQAARADWSAGPVALGTGYARHGRSLRVREVQRTLTRLEATPPAGEPRPVQPPRTPVAVAEPELRGLPPASSRCSHSSRPARSPPPFAGACEGGP